MRITWYGHASFLIETGGLRIILDPYRSPDSGGYLPIDEPADLVVVSHENDRYHSHLGQIRPPFKVTRGLEVPPEGVESLGLRFHAIPVFETPEKQPADEVTILHFEAEGLRVVHLGDLGHLLTPAEAEPIHGADLLIVPAGGPPTIDYPLIPALIKQLDPRWIVPMHYLTPRINLKIQPVERFFECLPTWPVEHVGKPIIDFTADSLLPAGTIYSLEHAR